MRPDDEPHDDEPHDDELHDVMRHVTFAIPVRIDSPDRLANLLTVSKVLSDFPSRVLVGCEEPAQMRRLLPPSVEVIGVPGPAHLPFHHTRLTNHLARATETEVLVNIEADIVIPPDQLRAAVRRVLRDGTDHVLPYDYAVDVARHERNTFAATPVSAQRAQGRRRWSWPVIGGCVVWNLASFRRMGMENEHLIAWGLDDDERMARVTRLGGRHERVPGPLFHLQHERGPDSSDQHPYAASNAAELARINRLDSRALAAEAAAWPWVRGPDTTPVAVAADDLTITIPVRLEHPDRRRNLYVAARAARATTTARVVVGLGDAASLEEPLPVGVELQMVNDPPGPFHRTRLLNVLAREVTTPFIANLDADVVVPWPQWADALARLRAGADLVLPYDGTMIDVPYAHHPWLERGDYAAMPTVLHGVLHPASVGGCVLWRREAFERAGMENERFVSWGAEDDERVDRARTLGLRVERCEGVVYHLRHARGPDSDATNPMFERNLAELARITAMDRPTLAFEVAGWPWCPSQP